MKKTDEMFTAEELNAVGLIGPPWCTCLDEVPMPGRVGPFCSFCEAVDRAIEARKANAA